MQGDDQVYMPSGNLSVRVYFIPVDERTLDISAEDGRDISITSIRKGIPG